MSRRGRPPNNEPKKIRQLAILRGAGRAFVEVGYDRASMDVIARTTKVTKATLYAYFSSKEELFRSVVDLWLDELPEPDFHFRPDSSLQELLGEVAADLQRQARHPAATTMTMILSSSAQFLTPQQLERWKQRYRPHQKYIENLLIQRGHSKSVSLAASQFLMLVIGSDSQSILTSVPDKPDKARAAFAVDLFLHAYPE